LATTTIPGLAENRTEKKKQDHTIFSGDEEQWVSCKSWSSPIRVSRTAGGPAEENGNESLLRLLGIPTRSALGTPLEWPEAKKVAGKVREWGIEVRHGGRNAAKAAECIVDLEASD
jgi:hypothetical protein